MYTEKEDGTPVISDKTKRVDDTHAFTEQAEIRTKEVSALIDDLYVGDFL